LVRPRIVSPPFALGLLSVAPIWPAPRPAQPAAQASAAAPQLPNFRLSSGEYTDPNEPDTPLSSNVNDGKLIVRSPSATFPRAHAVSRWSRSPQLADAPSTSPRRCSNRATASEDPASSHDPGIAGHVNGSWAGARSPDRGMWRLPTGRGPRHGSPDQAAIGVLTPSGHSTWNASAASRRSSRPVRAARGAPADGFAGSTTTTRRRRLPTPERTEDPRYGIDLAAATRPGGGDLDWRPGNLTPAGGTSLWSIGRQAVTVKTRPSAPQREQHPRGGNVAMVANVSSVRSPRHFYLQPVPTGSRPHRRRRRAITMTPTTRTRSEHSTRSRRWPPSTPAARS